VQTVHIRFTLCIVRGVPVARYATSIEVGAALAVSAATVARYARQGRLPFSTTPGGHRRFNIDEVRVALGRQAPVRVAAISTATAANRPRVRIGDAEPIGVSTAAFRREALLASFTPVTGMKSAAGDEAAAAANWAQLEGLLRVLRQGDLISLGAVSIVGRGPSSLLMAAGASRTDDVLWSITADSDVGWYVVLSQDCDIVRDLHSEPCLLVCPLRWADTERWSTLRHGPYSPREFPFPADKVKPPSGKAPVADVRVVTSIDKQALLSDHVATLRPLSAPQRERFAEWLGRRFARVPHDDMVTEQVLDPAARLIASVIRKGVADERAGKHPSASGRLCLAVDEWFVGGNDKLIELVALTSVASLDKAHLVDADAIIDTNSIESGRKWLENKLGTVAPAGAGYVIQLDVVTPDRLSAGEFRALAPWVFENPGDPLANDGKSPGSARPK